MYAEYPNHYLVVVKPMRCQMDCTIPIYLLFAKLCCDLKKQKKFHLTKEILVIQVTMLKILIIKNTLKTLINKIKNRRSPILLNTNL